MFILKKKYMNVFEVFLVVENLIFFDTLENNVNLVDLIIFKNWIKWIVCFYFLKLDDDNKNLVMII